MYRKILVATDGSTLSKKAVRSAIELAGAVGAELVALYVVPRYPVSYFEGGVTVSTADIARTEKQWADQGQAVVDAVREAAQAAGVKAKAAVSRSDLVAESILATGEEEQVRPGRDGLARPQGPQAHPAGQRNPARPHPQHRPRAGVALTHSSIRKTAMKILFAADGSKYTKKALAFLATHENLAGPDDELVVLHVQPPVPPRVKTMLGAGIVNDYHRDEAQKVLDPIERFLKRHNMPFRTSWVVGSPSQEILRVAQARKGPHDRDGHPRPWPDQPGAAWAASRSAS